MRKLLVGILFAFLLVFTSIKNQTLAAIQVSPSSAPEMNSFELFWPISAGRTLGDSLYFLKSFKETARGLLIFGQSQKVDYDVFLAVKRAVETEKLLGEGKNELAIITLDKMSQELDAAKHSIALSKSMSKDTTDNINNRLDNLEKFLAWLLTKSEPVKAKIQTLLDQVKEVNHTI